eukprot:gene2946-5791_t
MANAKRIAITNLSSHIRGAQAAECFRSTYSQSSNSSVRISSSDLDDIVCTRYVRPSILIGFWGTLGAVVGSISRFTPRPVKNAIEKIVDDAVQEQLNDSIRKMQDEGLGGDIDVKETIKFHRDLSLSESTIETSSVPSMFKSTAEGVLTLGSTGLKQLLGISFKI